MQYPRDLSPRIILEERDGARDHSVEQKDVTFPSRVYLTSDALFSPVAPISETAIVWEIRDEQIGSSTLEAGEDWN